MGARDSWWRVVVVHAGWSSVGGGEGGCRGPWALSVGAGYRLWALGVARARWVPWWVLGIVRGRWVVVGCVLCALGLLRVGSLLGVMLLLGVGSLLGVRSLFRALVVLGLSWDERGRVDVATYRDVTTNDDFRSSFVVQLPRRCL